MELSWDEAKRQATLQARALDFADCAEVFNGPIYTFPDERRDYGEPRFITVGFLKGRMIVMVHTPCSEATHIISMRKANEREIKRYQDYLG